MELNFGSGLEGAGGGALAGGSIGGPYGAIIGGGIGFLGGLFGNGSQDEMRQKLQDYYTKVQGMQPPQMGPASQSATSGFRKNQGDLINRLEAMSKGQGPSLAAQQFQQATDRNVSGQQAMANSGRGGPMSQLTAANNMASLGANAAQGSAIARTNEQLGAFSQLGGAINQGRGMDEANSQFNANAQNQNAQSNLMARLQAMGYSQRAALEILSQMAGNNAHTMGDELLAGGAGFYGMNFANGKGGKPAGAGPAANQSSGPGAPTSSSYGYGPGK